MRPKNMKDSLRNRNNLIYFTQRKDIGANVVILSCDHKPAMMDNL